MVSSRATEIVARGGDWNALSRYTRIAGRFRNPVNVNLYTVGIRLARPLELHLSEIKK